MEKRLFYGISETALSVFRKQIYGVIVVCHCVLKCWDNSLYNDIGHKKKLGSSFVYHRGFCSVFCFFFVFRIFLKKVFFGHMAP